MLEKNYQNEQSILHSVLENSKWQRILHMVKCEEEEWNIRMRWKERITMGKGGLHWALKFEQKVEGSEKLASDGKYFSLRE